jgi:hypothetical protein
MTSAGSSLQEHLTNGEVPNPAALTYKHACSRGSLIGHSLARQVQGRDPTAGSHHDTEHRWLGESNGPHGTLTHHKVT